MTDPFFGKQRTAEEALAPLRSGQHVVLGSGAAEPQRLVQALLDRGPSLDDMEITHLMTLGRAAYAAPEFEGRFRHNALFIGSNVREAVQRGLADYTPCHLCDVPELIRTGRFPVDVALIQVTAPEGGFCSLGVSVDIVKAAVHAAGYVVAQVNDRMPWTEGDSRVLVEDIDAFVVSDLPLPELREPDMTAAALWIGRYVAQLIENGSTLQIGLGAVPNSVLAALSEKKDLGIHSELITDALLPLIARGVVTGKRKSLHRERIVTSFCLGTKKLYDAVDRDQRFEFHPIDYVNDPAIIARNERMVAINSALQIDLTGQVAADSLGGRFYSGSGGQADFMRGAARAPGGKSIVALPATAKGGALSRIVANLSPGTGVVSTRADVDFVVTEYGIASLKGKTIRERAVALIQVAHPSFRKGLIEEAENLGYIARGRKFPPDCGPYLVELEAKRHFGKDEVFFRPLKPQDERGLKDLFYSQSQQTTLMRYGIPLKRLTEAEFQELVCIDFRTSMAIGAFVKTGGRTRLLGVGRYYCEPGQKLVEAAVTVHDDWQGKGIGSFLTDYLAFIARERGLHGFHAEMAVFNPRMRRLLERRFSKVKVRDLGEDGVAMTVLFSDWLGKGNPALEKAVALRE
jgi:acyl-CoA hydrolase/GNAT superfamily N-acetyltransferase